MIKKKSILSTLLLIIPMLVAIGFSTWIIIYEVLIRPNYIAPSGLSKFFDNAQTTYYNGVIQLPEQTSGDEIPSELLSYYYKLESESDENYELCTDTVGPKNAGTYSVLVTKTESEVVESCLVTLTIEKATPSIEKPTIIPGEIYEGQNAAYYGGVAYLENEYFPEGKEIIVQGSFSYTSSKGTSELKYSGTGEKSENKVNMTFTPQNGVEDGAINFKSVNFQVDLKLLHIAYISGDSGKLYFGSIEAALDYANSTKDSSMKNVIVVPELKEEDENGNTIKYFPTIKSNCTINNGVKLTLPYEGETFDGRQKGEETSDDKYFTDDAGDRFADETQELIDKYLMTNIIIEKGISLIVNSGGTLNIGGVTGNEADPSKQDNTYHNTDDIVLCGQTSGKYCQITMNSNSKIISDGTINCFGYIKESIQNNNSIIEANDGSINLPFVLYDYQGGWETIGSFCTDASESTSVGQESSVSLVTLLFSGGKADGNVSPFSIYDFPNIQSSIKFSYRANMIGSADIYSRATTVAGQTVPNQHNVTSVNVLGRENSMINLSDGAYALIKYNSNSNGFTLKDDISGKTNIKIYGGAESGVMSLTVKAAILTVTVTTKNIFLPVSWKYNIELYDGDYSIVNKIKFMGGSSLYVGNDASLKIDADTSIYPVTKDYNYVYPETQKFNSGKFIVDGSASINSPFSGIIETNTTDAFLEINNNNQAISVEGIGAQKDSTNSKFTVTMIVNNKAQGNINLNDISDFETKAYISEYQKDIDNQDKLTWTVADGYTNYSIIYDGNGGSFSSGNTKTETFPIKKNSSVTIHSVTSTIPEREHYTFGGWYLHPSNQDDSNLLKGSIVTDPEGDDKTATVYAYAKWTEKTYTIKYEINYQGEAVKTNQINNNTSEYKYSSTSISFSLPTDGDYKFSGWYIDEDYQNPFDISKSYSGSELFAKADAEGLLTLYGYFTDLVEYTVNFDTDTPDKDYGFESIKVVKNNFIENLDDEYSSQLELQKDNTLYSRYFVGWYSDIEKTQQFTHTTPVKSNMTLYAKWVDKENIVQYYDYADKIISGQTRYFIDGETLEITMPDVLKTGTDDKNDSYYVDYTFNGWIFEDEVIPSGTKKTVSNSINIKPDFTEYKWCYLNITLSNATIEITENSNASINKKYEASVSNVKVEYDSKLKIVVTYSGNYSKSLKVNDTNFSSGSTHTINSKITTISASSSTSCVITGTLINMADGTTKKVEDVKTGETVLVFNHLTGQFDTSIVMYNAHDKESWTNIDIINLVFDNGTIVKMVTEHAFFNLTLNEYSVFNYENVESFIGHEFFVLEDLNNINKSSAKLIDVYYTTEFTGVYSPVTANGLNCFTDGFLSITGDMKGFYNIFEFDENQKYDEELMKQDIEKYGLYTYEDFKDYVPEVLFDAYQGQYLKVSIGKGHTTFEEILQLIDKYINDEKLPDDFVNMFPQ